MDRIGAVSFYIGVALKIFVSWSGPVAEKIAGVVADWIPLIFPNAVPWLSTDGISAGQRGMAEIEKGLQGADFGVICVTPGNIGEPWLNFEAGAISNAVGGTARVVPLLTGFTSKVVKGPLQVFQAVFSDKAGFDSIAKSINESLADGARPQENLKRTLDAFWPQLNDKMTDLRREVETQSKSSTAGRGARAEKGQHEMIEEILLRVRSIQSIGDRNAQRIATVHERGAGVGSLQDVVNSIIRDTLGDEQVYGVSISEELGRLRVHIQTRRRLTQGERLRTEIPIKKLGPSIEDVKFSLMPESGFEEPLPDLS